MQRLCLCLLFLFVSAPAFAWSGVVVSAGDGDSLKVRDLSGKTVKIRLYGIDCPELSQPNGDMAAQMTRKLTVTQTVAVAMHYNLDRYGQTVATVYLQDGRCVQESRLLSGLAWVDERYCRAEICMAWQLLEGEARKHHSGLWADPEAVAPWDWRKRKDKELS